MRFDCVHDEPKELGSDLVDEILHVDLDLPDKLQGSFEINGLFSDTTNDALHIRSFTSLLHKELVNSLEDLRDVALVVDLLRVVARGKDVKEIFGRNEEESWESSLLRVQELIQRFLARLKIALDLLKLLNQVILDTELQDIHRLATISHQLLHDLVDADEGLRFCRKLLLYLFGMDEKVLEEGPGFLDAVQEFHGLEYGFEGGCPVLDLLLEVTDELIGSHVLGDNLMLLHDLEAVLRHLELLDIGSLVLDEFEVAVVPDLLDGLEGAIHLEFLLGLVSEFFDILIFLVEIQFPQ